MAALPEIDAFTHDHVFLGAAHDDNARRTLWVVALTAGMMVVEIIAGYLTGSMALLADGFHMATHAGALGVAAAAYAYAKRHASSRAYSFGTGKVGDLAGFAVHVRCAELGGDVPYASREARRVRDVEPQGMGDVHHPVVGGDVHGGVGGHRRHEPAQRGVHGGDLLAPLPRRAAVEVTDLVHVAPVEVDQ